MAKKIFLSEGWGQSHVRQIKSKAGPRYRPKLNVRLPISLLFDGLTRNKRFYETIRTNYGELERSSIHISPEVNNDEIKKLVSACNEAKTQILQFLQPIKEYNTEIIPWAAIIEAVSNGEKAIWSLTDKLKDERSLVIKQQNPEERKSGEQSLAGKIDSNIRDISKIEEKFKFFSKLGDENSARLSNCPFLLIKGEAGNGKTHLLCDVIQGRINERKSLPSALVFAEFITNEADIWKQLAMQLELSSYYYKEGRILEALDNAGRKASCRALLVIDALNESRPMTLWVEALKTLYNEALKYPNVALVVSVRNGFEQEVVTKEVLAHFTVEEHIGFKFQQWEAVTKFFREFALPMPEISLLLPEFQNPLFLLLFCMAFSNRASQSARNKKRQIFRGHEGATYIFENFVKSVADKIARQLNVSKGRNSKNEYFIWDTIIERVAMEMVRLNSDRIPEEKFIEIVQEAHPTINQNKLLNSLEKNLLIVKVTRYSYKNQRYEGFDYRFPFQKFSDHLRGRYIFKESKASLKTPKQFFSKNTKIGKFIAEGWDRGLIEALSIQCPEWYGGLEFFEVAPYLSIDQKGAAFVDSLIWRKVDAFAKDSRKLLKLINEYIDSPFSDGKWHVLSTLLSVAPISEHPFNADFLHENLMRRNMPKRDAWLATFLHYENGRHGSVDRLVEWGWSEHDKSKLSYESMRLCAIPLVWFLSSSNRFLRDKSTKALVSLLTNHLSIVKELLKQFKDVDDPYILERLYAVAYGCILRNCADNEVAKEIAEWIIQNFFHKNPIVNILMRDYARGIVEVAIRRNLIDTSLEKIRPPFYSKWPNSIPTGEFLKEKYYPEKNNNKSRMEYYDIWHSLMYNFGGFPADFGNYVVNSTLGHWTGRRLNKKYVHKKQLFEDFKKSLTREQKRLFDMLTLRFAPDVTFSFEMVDSATANKNEKERKRIKEEKIAKFKNSLSSDKRDYFEKDFEPHFDGYEEVKDPLDYFNNGLGQRWIFNRIIQLGWNPKLHGHFEKTHLGMHYRHGAKAERISKKYQWIALYEFLARVSDNFEFKKDTWSNESSVYEGPWQIGMRNIDPSCILKNSPKENVVELPVFEKQISDLVNWDQQITSVNWLTSMAKLPNPKKVIEFEDSDGKIWLLLDGTFHWEEPTLPEQKRYDVPRRQIWYGINGYLIKKSREKVIFNWAKRQDYFGDWMPKTKDFYNVFLGEYPNSVAFKNYDIPYYYREGWTNKAEGRTIPAKILITNDGYKSKDSSLDCSTEDAVVMKLPSKWIIDKMKLSQKDMDGRYFTEEGVLAVFDPWIFNPEMTSCLLMRKDIFLDFLKRKGYSIIWTIMGEKNRLGGNLYGAPNGWTKINGAYLLTRDKKLVGSRIMKPEGYAKSQ